MNTTLKYRHTEKESLPKLQIYNAEQGILEKVDPVFKTDSEWRLILDPLVYRVTRKHGTERPFTGKYYNHKKKGIYRCACCGNDLFNSNTKFDSGSGWPSFMAPVAEQNIVTRSDVSLFLYRTEVLCVRCGAHLGHVFDDGPSPEHKRYCINSAALTFIEYDERKKGM